MESLIRHITKLEFLPAFKAAFDRSFTPANICSVFLGAGLVPLQQDAVLSKLDVKLRTPTPPALEDLPWLSQTPSNTLELGSQSTLSLKQLTKPPRDENRTKESEFKRKGL